MTPSAASRYAFIPGAVAVAVVDQLAKLLVVRLMSPGDSIAVLGPVMSLTYARNTGGAFSLVQGSTGLLALVSLCVVAVLVVYGVRAKLANRLIGWGLALVMGGAGGNLVDRAFRGWVVDFIDLHFWPVFNVADIAITVGVVLIGWQLLAPSRSVAGGDAEAGSSDPAAT